MTAADQLVQRYPTRAAQLRGPVLAYLAPYRPFPTLQSLAMAVFYPDARLWSPDTPFPAKVQRANPGIVTVRDYVDRVAARSPRLSSFDADTLAALRDTSAKLGVPSSWLAALIDFESRWDPAARNPISGARGLIQFMPRTAKALGVAILSGLAAIAILVLVYRYTT